MLIKPWEELSKSELYDCIKLRLDVFSVEQNCPYQDCDDLDQNASHLMIYQEEKLIGYLRIFESLDKYKGNASIGRVCSHQSKRTLGVGKILMQKAIDYIDQNYSKTIQIS